VDYWVFWEIVGKAELRQELDIGEPKRTLVHAGYVFRRVRSETNWHGW
jgi:hypothetical protein